MLNWLALSPILVLLFGALLLIPLSRLTRLSRLVAPGSILTSLLLLAFNARQPDSAPYLTTSTLQVPDVDLRLDLAPALLVFAALALSACLAWLLVARLQMEARLSGAMLVTLAGAIGFLCSDNWATMAAGWFLADLGLLAWRVSPGDPRTTALAWRSFGLGIFGMLGLVAGAVLLMAIGSSMRIQDSALGGWGATLILLAGWVRAGLFPFQILLPLREPGSMESSGPDGPGKLLQRKIKGHGVHASTVWPGLPDVRIPNYILGSALSVLLGLTLLIRSLLGLQDSPALPEALYAFVLLALLATILLTLIQPGRRRKLYWGVLSIGAPLLLIPFIPQPTAHPALATWLSLGFFHSLALLAAARLLRAHTARQPWPQVLMLLAIASAAGFPLTPGFLGRIGLYAALLGGASPLLLALLPVALTFGLIPLWRAFLDERPDRERRPAPIEYLGLGLLILPPLLEGIVPFVVMSFFGRAVEDASAFAYDALLHAPNTLESVVLFLAVILPPPIAILLARQQREWEDRLERTPAFVTQIVDGTLPAKWGVGIVDACAVVLRQVSTLIEQHPVGWVLFAALWVAFWLLDLR